MMHWVLQEGFLSETGWAALIATLTRFGLPHSIHAVTPKTGELAPDIALPHGNAICIGSYSMRHVAARFGWSPGVFDLFEQDFERQRAHWGARMLNFHSKVGVLAEVVFDEPRLFVRPFHDSKHFSGRVFARDEFEAWRQRICAPDAQHGASLTPQTLVQVSRPVVIHAEYRFWVVKGRIVTQSLYRRGSAVIYSSEVDERVARFVSECIAIWSPHETFVIDACDTEDGMRIVEINTLNASGFYAADVQRLVLALDEAYSA